MIRKLSDADRNHISIPRQICEMLNDAPNMEVSLIDYDYAGDAEDSDFVSFATMVYEQYEDSHLVVVMSSNEMSDSRLLRKTFRFDLSGYAFSQKIRTWCVSVDEANVVFLGTLQINTFDDFKNAIKFLFSGIYESNSFVLSSRDCFDETCVRACLANAMCVNYGRHGNIKNVSVSLKELNKVKNGTTILYPYGGTDFGSFMFFVF